MNPCFIRNYITFIDKLDGAIKGKPSKDKLRKLNSNQ